MRLIGLELTNFRQHKSTEIQFPSGLTGILGENGSGKSTILEAIAWVLYGNQKGVARGDVDSLIWRQAPGKSAASVMLKFAFGDRHYQIKRSQSSSRGTVDLQQDGRTIANSNKAVAEKLTEIIGMSHTEFFNSYFTGQKDLSFLGSIKGATERERFIAKMLGYEKITAAQGEAGKAGSIRSDRRNQQRQVDRLEGSRGDLDKIKAQITFQQTELEAAQSSSEAVTVVLMSALEQKQALEPQLTELEQKRDRHVELDKQQQIKTAALTKLTQQIDRLGQEQVRRREAVGKYDRLSQALQNYDQIKAQHNHLSELKQAATRRNDLSVRLPKLRAEITELKQNLDRLDQVESRLAKTKQAIAHFQQELETTEAEIRTQTRSWQEQQANLRAQITSEQKNLRNITKQKNVIVQAGHDGICPTCERPLQAEYDTVVGNFASQVVHLESHIKEWQQQLSAIDAPPPSLQQSQQQQLQLKQDYQNEQRLEQQLTADLAKRQLWQKAQDEKQAEVTNVTAQIAAIPSGFDAQTHTQLEQQLQQLEPQREEFLRLANAPQQLQDINAQLSELTQEKAQVETAIAELNDQIQLLKFDPAAYAQVKQAIATASQELEAARIAQIEAKAKVENTQKMLELAQQQEVEFHRRDAEYQKAKQELILLDELDSAFTELRQYLTEQIRPQLAESASIFLTQLTDGRYDAIEIDPKYNILVLDHGDPKPVISGGEEDIVNLCLRLAISQMITERSGQPFSLLILDEVFGSLDQGRRENVIGLLHSLEQQFEQVLIISHIEAIKEGVNQAIRLEFDPQEQCSKLVSA